MSKKTVNIGQMALTILLMCLGLLFVAGGFAFLREKNYDIKLNKLHSIEEKVHTWLADYRKANDAGDDAALQNLIMELNTLLPEIDRLSTQPYRYIKQVALFSKGMIYSVQEDDAGSAEIFESLFRKYGKSVLGVKAGLNAAAAYENMDSEDRALSLYKKVSRCKNVPNFWQEASFHVARMLETNDRIVAIEAYRTLINKLEDGNFWRTLSENRVLLLETQQ